MISIAFFLRSSDSEEDCNCVVKKVQSETGDYPAIIGCTVVANNNKLNNGDELIFFIVRGSSNRPKKVCAVNLACMPAVKKAKKA